MKNGVAGVLTVVRISRMDVASAVNRYRLDGVVSAPGVTPTAIVHHGKLSLSQWPSAGQKLPVTVNRAEPQHIAISWPRVPFPRSATE
jgi:hypothetical protein